MLLFKKISWKFDGNCNESDKSDLIAHYSQPQKKDGLSAKFACSCEDSDLLAEVRKNGDTFGVSFSCEGCHGPVISETVVLYFKDTRTVDRGRVLFQIGESLIKRKIIRVADEPGQPPNWAAISSPEAIIEVNRSLPLPDAIRLARQRGLLSDEEEDMVKQFENQLFAS